MLKIGVGIRNPALSGGYRTWLNRRNVTQSGHKAPIGIMSSEADLVWRLAMVDDMLSRPLKLE